MQPDSGQAGRGQSAAGSRPRLSREDFAQLFEGSYRALWGLAAGLTGDRSGADDIVQQAAVIALPILDEFDPATSFLAWMGRIVRNTALNEARKHHRRRTSPADPSDLDRALDAHPTAEAPGVGSHGELRDDEGAFDDELRRALLTLEPTARACLLLRTVIDLPYAEIARALGVPEGTAMSHVHRSRRAVRERLRERRGGVAGGPPDDAGGAVGGWGAAP